MIYIYAMNSFGSVLLFIRIHYADLSCFQVQLLIVISLLMFSWSPISSGRGSKNFEGVPYTPSWCKRHNLTIWSNVPFSRREYISSHSWFNFAVVISWVRAGFGFSWESSWWYLYFPAIEQFLALFSFSRFHLSLKTCMRPQVLYDLFSINVWQQKGIHFLNWCFILVNPCASLWRLKSCLYYGLSCSQHTILIFFSPLFWG